MRDHTTKVKEKYGFSMSTQTFHLCFLVTLELRNNQLTLMFTFQFRLLVFTFQIYIQNMYLAVAPILSDSQLEANPTCALSHTSLRT